MLAEAEVSGPPNRNRFAVMDHPPDREIRFLKQKKAWTSWLVNCSCSWTRYAAFPPRDSRNSAESIAHLGGKIAPCSVSREIVHSNAVVS
jgi:hypothetical protein